MQTSFLKTFCSGAVLINLLCSCSRYYMAETKLLSTPQSKSKMIDSLIQQKKYFLMHTSGEVYGIDSMAVDTTKLTISGLPTNVSPKHTLYLKPHKYFIWGKNRTFTKAESGILNEVHFWVDEEIYPTRNSFFKIPIKTIEKINTIEFDEATTTKINIISVVVVTAVTIAVIVPLEELSKW